MRPQQFSCLFSCVGSSSVTIVTDTIMVLELPCEGRQIADRKDFYALTCSKPQDPHTLNQVCVSEENSLMPSSAMMFAVFPASFYSRQWFAPEIIN